MLFSVASWGFNMLTLRYFLTWLARKWTKPEDGPSLLRNGGFSSDRHVRKYRRVRDSETTIVP